MSSINCINYYANKEKSRNDQYISDRKQKYFVILYYFVTEEIQDMELIFSKSLYLHHEAFEKLI